MNGRKKILLVEDDPMITGMYRNKLDIEEYEVWHAANGQEALETLKKRNKPDIILLDIMMPKMNGISTLKTLKADPALKDIPVIILTNLGDRPEDVQKCKELGAEDYWVKANISLSEITEKIEKILR